MWREKASLRDYLRWKEVIRVDPDSNQISFLIRSGQFFLCTQRKARRAYSVRQQPATQQESPVPKSIMSLGLCHISSRLVFPIFVSSKRIYLGYFTGTVLRRQYFAPFPSYFPQSLAFLTFFPCNFFFLQKHNLISLYNHSLNAAISIIIFNM